VKAKHISILFFLNFTFFVFFSQSYLCAKSSEEYSMDYSYDMSTCKIQIDGSTSLTINISAQPDGVYFVKVKTPDGVAVKKIVKE